MFVCLLDSVDSGPDNAGPSFTSNYNKNEFAVLTWNYLINMKLSN